MESGFKAWGERNTFEVDKLLDVKLDLYTRSYILHLRLILKLRAHGLVGLCVQLKILLGIPEFWPPVAFMHVLITKIASGHDGTR